MSEKLVLDSFALVSLFHDAVSYADAFCIATARRINGTVLTNDSEFRAVQHLIKIRWLTK